MGVGVSHSCEYWIRPMPHHRQRQWTRCRDWSASSPPHHTGGSGSDCPSRWQGLQRQYHFQVLPPGNPGFAGLGGPRRCRPLPPPPSPFSTQLPPDPGCRHAKSGASIPTAADNRQFRGSFLCRCRSSRVVALCHLAISALLAAGISLARASLAAGGGVAVA